ncbi:putative lipid II flippase FtsW [bacterium]|nr:putative lipid II flippase FtsW [bacterium]
MSKNNVYTRALLTTVGILLFFGVLMIYDATAVQSQNIYGHAYKFVLLQLSWVLVGLLGFLFFYRLSYKKIGKIAYLLFFGSLVFLAILAIFSLIPCDSSPAVAPCINGANRWLYLNPPPLPSLPLIGVLGFQPAELAKLALILYLSFQLCKNLKKGEDPFVVYMVSTGIAAGLILLQPNLSTAVLVFGLGTLVYFVSGFSLKPMIFLIPIVVGLTFLAIFLSPYRRTRLMTYLSGDVSTESPESYHVNQISIALGTGGFLGVGFGESRQKYQYLPEVASDSIFAIIGEEFGFVGTTGMVCLFVYLIYLGVQIAQNAPDLKGRMIATGITSWLGLQVLVNVAAMVRLVPLTGVPLPLISYGGSSMVFTLMGLGVLASVSRES